MATRMRSYVRCSVNLVLPFLFFASLISLSTRQPLLDVAVRQDVAPGRLRVFVVRDRAAKNTSVTTVAAGPQVSDIAAVATEGADDGNVLTADAPQASGDANVTADNNVQQESGSGIAAVVAREDGAAEVVTDAPPASAVAKAEPRGSDSDTAAAASTAGSDTSADADDTVVFDFRPYVLVYKSGRVHRFHGTETVQPGVDALTGVASTDIALAGGVGVGVGARLYLPPPKNRREGRRGKKKKLPVLLYFHGGAFVIESPFSPLYHAFLNILVAKAGILAVAVDYRLAPEHPLPAAYDDAWAALRWTASNCLSGPEAWLADHGDAARIFLAGDSAGANIAHNLAVRAGAEPPLPGGATIAGVVLLNPYFWGKEPVGTEPGEQWVRDGLEQTWALVCGGRYGIDDPHVNPLVAPGSLRGMAGERVLVTIAGRDNFRDRAAAYAEGLRRSGWRGEVETYVTEGEAHVHFVGNPRSERAERETDKVAEFIGGGSRGND